MLLSTDINSGFVYVLPAITSVILIQLFRERLLVKSTRDNH